MDEPQPGYPPDRVDAPTAAHDLGDSEAPTEALVSGTVGDRCVNCGSPLTSDQRYCVNCGERRGAPRFTLPTATAAAAAEPTAPLAASRPSRGGSRLGIGAVIAGVATLLLAMLVGVLIGHNAAGGGTKTVASAPVRIITAGGGASGAAASGSTAGSGSTSGSTTKKVRKSSAKPKATKTPVVAKKAAAKEQSAASKVLGGKSAPAATVTVGQTGSGKGYNKKTHKFDGSFFGQ